MKQSLTTIQHRKDPRADKRQQNHLFNRIEAHADEITPKWSRWKEFCSIVEPAEIKKMRRRVEAWDRLSEFKVNKERSKINKVKTWLREKIFFAPATDSLMLTKAFEMMTLEEVLAAHDNLNRGMDAVSPTLFLKPVDAEASDISSQNVKGDAAARGTLL